MNISEIKQINVQNDIKIEYNEKLSKNNFFTELPKIIHSSLLPDNFATSIFQAFEYPIDEMSIEDQGEAILKSFFIAIQEKEADPFQIDEFLVHIDKERKIAFIQSLLQKIQINDWSYNLIKENFKENLRNFAWQTWAELATFDELIHSMKSMDVKERLCLLAYCFMDYKEGSFLLTCALETLYVEMNLNEKIILEGFKHYYYDPSLLTSILKENHKIDIEEIIKTLEEKAAEKGLIAYNNFSKDISVTVTFEEFQQLLRIFGLYSYEHDDYYFEKDLALSENNINISPGIKRVQDLEIKRFKKHLEALANPAIYKEGLDLITWALPTAGKKLDRFAWLPSVIKGVQEAINVIKLKDSRIKLEDYPIVIIDQSNELIFKENESYINGLSKNTGAQVLHVSREQALLLAEKIDAKQLIQTTKDGKFGYGGARNATYFLAPILRELARQGKNLETILSMPNHELKAIFNTQVLESKKCIHMGDDDTEIPIANIFEDILLAQENQNVNFLKEAKVKGRNTNNNVSLPQNVFSSPNIANLAVRWTEGISKTGMSGSLSKPRFCLNLPYGAEEAQGPNLHFIQEKIGHSMIHLAGNRAPKDIFLTKPYIGAAERLKEFAPYTFGISVMEIFSRGSSLAPWKRMKDRIKRIDKQLDPQTNLHETFKMISTLENQYALQSNFWGFYAYPLFMGKRYSNNAMSRNNIFRIYTESLTSADTIKVTRESERKSWQEFEKFHQTAVQDANIANYFIKKFQEKMYKESNIEQEPLDILECFEKLWEEKKDIISIIKEAKKECAVHFGVKFSSLPFAQTIYRVMRVLGGGEFSHAVKHLLK